ncbi:MAG TPA: hypothetical protein DD706_18690 [Nitrospiraceae bacterium]|nr:hypothetical protein [Nitrospiraceae bacterium]
MQRRKKATIPTKSFTGGDGKCRMAALRVKKTLIEGADHISVQANHIQIWKKLLLIKTVQIFGANQPG